MGKNKKIQKNRDIEELVYQEERRIEKDSQTNKRQQFVKSIKVTILTEEAIEKRIRKEVAKKVENHFQRKDAERADEIKKENYQKLIGRIQNPEAR